jgi:hypothetical protein
VYGFWLSFRICSDTPYITVYIFFAGDNDLAGGNLLSQHKHSN